MSDEVKNIIIQLAGVTTLFITQYWMVTVGLGITIQSWPVIIAGYIVIICVGVILKLLKLS